jgi:hypothetical protein
MVDRRCSLCWVCCTLCVICRDLSKFRLYDPGGPPSRISLIGHSLLLYNVVIDFVLFLLTGSVFPVAEAFLVIPAIINIGMLLSIQNFPWLHDEETENVLHNDEALPARYRPYR